MILKILFISSLLCSCFYSQALFADWPRHRGDAALNGFSETQLGNSLELKWSYDTGDYLKSSVVVENGVAYTGSEDGVLLQSCGTCSSLPSNISILIPDLYPDKEKVQDLVRRKSQAD